MSLHSFIMMVLIYISTVGVGAVVVVVYYAGIVLVG